MVSTRSSCFEISVPAWIAGLDSYPQRHKAHRVSGGQPALFIGYRREATEVLAGQGVATETPAGVLMQYVEEVEGAQRSPAG